MLHPSPRHFLPDATLPGAGLPGDCMARLEARKTFAELKLDFLDATDALAGREADWLRQQLRHAQQPVDLWLLRGALFDALGGNEPERRLVRARLRRSLDMLFPDFVASSGFGPVDSSFASF
jgi:hypothetical protein